VQRARRVGEEGPDDGHARADDADGELGVATRDESLCSARRAIITTSEGGEAQSTEGPWIAVTIKTKIDRREKNEDERGHEEEEDEEEEEGKEGNDTTYLMLCERMLSAKGELPLTRVTWKMIRSRAKMDAL
jgi:hypothetical protein